MTADPTAAVAAILERPRIGVNTFVWTSPLRAPEVSDLVRRIAGWGFEAVEFPLETPGDWDPGMLGTLLRVLGLDSVICAVFAPGRELTAAEPQVIASTQEYLAACIDAAAAQGAGIVAGPMYTSVGRTWRASPAERQAAVRTLVESLKPMAELAHSRGVRLALEPLNRYETSLINTVEQALEVVDQLPAEAVGLNLDTYHLNIEEKDIGAAIRSAGDRMIHLQVCGNDRGAPGQDHLDWAGIGRALGDIGYQGILGIESFTAENETIATAASIWRPLAESQDRLATDGLAFLQQWRQGIGPTG